jgi:hypothetical protein
MPSMTGYTKLPAARRSSLPIPEAHTLPCLQSHVSAWQVPARVPPSRQLLVRYTYISIDTVLTGTGPFELTKLSAQISVLMADRNEGGAKNDAIRKSYQNLGTFRTAQNLIKHRGWRGLYSGFHLHLRAYHTKQSWGQRADQTQSATPLVPVSTL